MILKWVVSSFVAWRRSLKKLNLSVSAKGCIWIGIVSPQKKIWSKMALGWVNCLCYSLSQYLLVLLLFLLSIWMWNLWILLFVLPTFPLECSCLILHSRLKTQLPPAHVMLTYHWNIQTWTPGIFHLLFICWADAGRATAVRNPAGQVLPVGVIEKQ